MSKSGIPIVSNIGKAASAIGRGDIGGALKQAAPIALGFALPGVGSAIGGGLSSLGSALGIGGAAAGAAGAGGLGSLGGSLLGNAYPTVGASTNLLGGTSLGTLGTLTNSIFGGGGQTVDAIAKGAGQLLGLGGGGGSILGGLGGQATGMGGQQGGILSSLLGGLSGQDLLIGGGSLASSIYGANVAEKAAKSQREAIDNAIASLREGQGTARADVQRSMDDVNALIMSQQPQIETTQDVAASYLTPYYQAGTAGLGQLQQLAMGQGVPEFLATNPAYQFRQQEAQKALERSAAARGGLLSGQFAKALQERSQGLASEEFGNAFNRLSGVVGMGQQAGQQLTGLRERTGERLLNMTAGRAENRAQAGRLQAGISEGFAGSLADLMRSRGDAVATGQIGQANAYNQGLANLTQYATAPKYRFATVGV